MPKYNRLVQTKVHHIKATEAHTRKGYYEKKNNINIRSKKVIKNNNMY